MTEIASVPVTYAGVRFRSTLEADWAATLKSLGIIWQYEPEAVRLPSGQLYRPDFYLPRIATWLEVKGPHDERVGKARELAEAVRHQPAYGGGGEQCACLAASRCQVVVIGRAAVHGLADWVVLDPKRTPADARASMFRCPRCDAWQWFAPGHCRACGSDGWDDWDDDGRRYHVPGTKLADPYCFGSGNEWPDGTVTGLPFTRVPRRGRSDG